MIEIKIKGDKEIVMKMENLSSGLKNMLVGNMWTATKQIQQKARRLVPVDTGDLRESIENVVRTTDKDITGIVGASQPYAAHVEFGTRPHWIPLKDPQKSAAFRKWCKKRGLNPYAVARAIAKKGTKPHPYLIPAFEQLKQRVINSFKLLIERELKK